YPALDECFSSSSNKPSICFLPLHNPLPPTTPFSSRTKAKGVTRTRKSRKNRFLRSQKIFPRISRPLTNSSNFFLSPTPIRTKFNLFWYFIQHWFHSGMSSLQAPQFGEIKAMTVGLPSSSLYVTTRVVFKSSPTNSGIESPIGIPSREMASAD